MADNEPLRNRPFYKNKRWRIALGGLFLVVIALSTEVHLSKPYEDFATPGKTEEEFGAAIDHKDWGAAFGIVAQRALEGRPEYLRLIGEAYIRGRKPVGWDECRAFDAFVAAGIKGNVESQGAVAEMLLDGYGGYQDTQGAYLWASYAAARGDIHAKALLKVDFGNRHSRLSAGEKETLDRKISTWEPADYKLEKLYRLPFTPIHAKFLALFLPVRDCNDRVVLQVLLNKWPALSFREQISRELRRREMSKYQH